MKKLPFKNYDQLVVPAIGTVQGEWQGICVPGISMPCFFPLWHYQNAHIKQKQDPEL